MTKSKKPIYTLEEMKFFLNYDPETGVFTRIRGTKVGETTGVRSKDGYIYVNFFYRKYFAHILAWWFMTGTWPDKQIDHINCDKSDNRFANLRLTTPRLNCMNRGARKDNKTGLKGVVKKGKKWRAGITVNYEKKWLGYYDTPEEAHEAYKKAALESAGEYAKW